MVVGDRLSNGTYAQQNARAFHGFGNDLVRAMIRWIYGYGFEDVMTGYRAMSRPFVKTFPVLSEGFQIETELSSMPSIATGGSPMSPWNTETAPRARSRN